MTDPYAPPKATLDVSRARAPRMPARGRLLRSLASFGAGALLFPVTFLGVARLHPEGGGYGNAFLWVPCAIGGVVAALACWPLKRLPFTLVVGLGLISSLVSMLIGVSLAVATGRA